MKIQVNDAVVTIVNGPFVSTRPYYNSSQVAVKVTKACDKCGHSISFIRGGVYSGSSVHPECQVADDFMQSVLGTQTPSQYQQSHGVAWNE